MNSNAEPQLLDLDALTRELLFTPPVLHSENALHQFPPRSGNQANAQEDYDSGYGSEVKRQGCENDADISE
jgi:hypothetical protein